MTNSAIIKGNSLFKVCSNNPSITCSANSDCPGNALCIVSFLKETYLFRSARNRVISSFEALDNGSGSSINLSWVSGAEGVSRFLVYFSPTGSSATPSSVSVATSACQLTNLNTQYSCNYVLNGLNSDQSYNVRVVALNSNSLELGSSFYTSVMPIFVPMVNPFTAVDTTLGRELTLSWQSSITNVDSYRLSYRMEGEATDSSVALPLNGNCERVADKYYCAYKLKNLVDGKSYTLKISALKSGGGEIGSSRVVSATPTYLYVPIVSNLKATDTSLGGTVKVDWDTRASAQFTSYNVCSFLSGVGTSCMSFSKNSCTLSGDKYLCTFNRNNLVNNRSYEIYVTVINGSQTVETSSRVSATPTFVPFVTNFSAVDAGSGGRINLSWQSPKANVVRYYMVNGSGSINHLASLCQSSGNNYVCSGSLIGLTNGQTYNVRVDAYNSSNQFVGMSPSISVVPTAPIECPDSVEYNGYDYSVVSMGSTCWFAESLRTGTTNSGGNINNFTDNDDWSNSFPDNEIACSWYKNDFDAHIAFGLLYNKIAVDSGELCPKGWHIPKKSEVDQMVNYLKNNNTFWCNNFSTNIAKSIASKDKWALSSTLCYPGNNMVSNNSSRFNALPAGLRTSDGDFKSINDYAYFWEGEGVFYIGNNSTDIGRIVGIDDSSGFSVRCVMD
jgi:uncharacterized protein (TIGR02145 family)